MVSLGGAKHSRDESLVRAAIDSTADGILVIDLAGKVRLYNAQFCEMWKIQPAFLEGQDDYRLLEYVLSQLDDPSEFLRRVRDLYAQPDLESFDQIKFKDGRFIERLSKPQRVGQEIVGRVWSFRDVTQRRLAENALRDAIRVRDEFLSIASHELYTPIHSLMLALQMLSPNEDHPPTPPEIAARMTELAIRQVQRLSKLVGSLLDVTRVDAGTLKLTPERFDVGSMVTEVAERFTADLVRSGSELVLDVPPGIEGSWDRSRIEQVVTNLLSNAIKFGLGKPIEVTVRRAKDRSGYCAILSVTDHGIGIPPDQLRAVFERFVRAVPADHYGGLGLGLYVCRKIVEAHGGALAAASRVGEGSTFTMFTMSLPLALKGDPNDSQRACGG
ncbi:MAG: Signal transduction histidine kinase CheA [Myxococcales bacterium]|nr:Signal transduction histidine kinase CheA [Myxococcales bacterium]